MAVIWQSLEYVGHASVRTPGILIERRRPQRVNSSGLRLLLLLTDRAPLELGYHPQFSWATGSAFTTTTTAKFDA